MPGIWPSVYTAPLSCKRFSVFVKRLKLTELFLQVVESLKFCHPHPRFMPL